MVLFSFRGIVGLREDLHTIGVLVFTPRSTSPPLRKGPPEPHISIISFYFLFLLLLFFCGYWLVPRVIG